MSGPDGSGRKVAGPKGEMFHLIREAPEGWDGTAPVRPFPDLSRL
ncbi:MAG TPA: hypothetical protein VGV17_12420 [Bosea sp. (in: a-proteobacteria)]|jgi:hypothetical protein|nr:hypothetical protein [Bosea sp. (in: a-proteobacteria)]HEV2554554.1 hypothetical protein [Bosea sp. (in: a-proteobacteria)]